MFSPSGVKSFVLSYRFEGRRRFLILGRYGELTPKAAEKKALRALVDLADGIEPSREKRAVREAPTVEDLKARYTTDHAETKKKKKSQANDLSMWNNHVLPRLGSRKVASITPADIARLHSALRDTPYAANRVVALLSKAFNLAETWGWRDRGSNPCSDIERYPERARERYLTQAELERLGRVLAEVEAEQSTSPSVVTALRLLLLTGCRLDEILRLRWEHVQPERGGLWLPDSKVGHRLVPVCAAVFEILDSSPRVPDNPWVLPGRRKGRRLINLSKPWYDIRERAGIPDVRIHDLRHTYATVGVGFGLSLPILGNILGHSDSATTARYAHIAESPVRQGVELIGGSIADALQAA